MPHTPNDHPGALDGAQETEMHADTENEFADMTEKQFETFLSEAIDDNADEADAPLQNILTFAEAGVMTYNKGLVVRIGDSEFQVTIVRSR